ncbi:tyrosine-type recombinase/integrase [Humisphaera borealis]|uniref:Site-specific integrase n=1 Tax=Humisphaera borealis TaxID=2807512 RepID=A0A7M2X5J6_9BACT|nr:site-specific integrase [Humisphaera borealis]
MASLIEDGDNLWHIQFFRPGVSGRQTIRPGKMPRRDAERFMDKIESLLSALKQNRPVDDATATWVAKLEGPLRTKLEAKGLIAPAASEAKRTGALGEMFDKWLGSLDIKLSTQTAYRQVRRDLVAYFGADRDIATIGPLEADEWRQAQKAKGLAEATLSRRVKTCRHFFRKAVKWKLIPENPFEDVKAGSQKNDARKRFISQEVAQKVLIACPDAEWRLIFALSRYGGLRCPSEHLGLRWGDIDWDRERILVHAPKTEHYSNKGTRVIPMFPELKRYLLEVFQNASEGSEFVITRYRNPNSNLRTQLMRIIDVADVEPWPRLFHNLRATRQTELCEIFPGHVVCQWLGNSEDVAKDHYLQVTDQHYERAAQMTEPGAQKPAQPGRESTGNTSQNAWPQNAKTAGVPAVATECESSHSVRMASEGLEPSRLWGGGF